ncbi:MAG: hypothetical protein AB1635_18590 [Acidobacteriota bacterium]
MLRTTVSEVFGILALASTLVAADARAQATIGAGANFQTSDACLACHNQLVTPAGEDVSFGTAWRPSMMANAARDPYWQAAVRREVLDFPGAAAAIEHECAACHMPMARYEARAAGARGSVFAHLPIGGVPTAEAALAADGVGCAACHRMSEAGFGARDSFNAGFLVERAPVDGVLPMVGPFAPKAEVAGIMRSASGFSPAEARHIQRSEMCATCHTLYTHALAPGAGSAELPEQMPYREWLHSAYRAEKSCQDCHMPEVPGETPVSSVLGDPRPRVSRHEFAGANFFMPRLLAAHATDLGVSALVQELDAASRRAVDHVRREAAAIAITTTVVTADRLVADITVTNRAGHKLPTAYPSRRAWLHVTVRDAAGAVIFESGAVDADGRIAGNDNDRDAGAFEPHYMEITRPDEVQIYEAVMGDPRGAVTTGLLSAVRYLKDNRILPRGFDKRVADADVAVHGAARDDADFAGGADRVRYVVAVAGRAGPFEVEAVLRYQPIGYRWAANLAAVPAPEPERFTRYYGAAAGVSSIAVAGARVTAR